MKLLLGENWQERKKNNQILDRLHAIGAGMDQTASYKE